MKPIEILKKKNKIELLQLKLKNMRAYCDLENRKPTAKQCEIALDMIEQIRALEAELARASNVSAHTMSPKLQAMRKQDPIEARAMEWGTIA
jgi:hypothetical protein